jgi:hypothetical protein
VQKLPTNEGNTQFAHAAVQMEGLKPPPLSGVHLNAPPEYIPLQHPFLHWEFLEHSAQSPSVPDDPDVAVHTLGLKPPLRGVHLFTPPEYIPLQHPFLHWEFEEHCAQSPSVPLPVVTLPPPVILKGNMVRNKSFLGMKAIVISRKLTSLQRSSRSARAISVQNQDSFLRQRGYTHKLQGYQDANPMESCTCHTRQEYSCLRSCNAIEAIPDRHSTLREAGTCIDNPTVPNHLLPAFQGAQEECKRDRDSSGRSWRHVPI